MSMTPKDAVEFVRSNEAEFVDIRFTDLFGMWHHFTMPAQNFTEDLFEEGLGFDGSSLRGFQSINESDMLLVPDPDTLFMDPFYDAPTACVVCNIEDPITRQPYSKDPRFVALKAEQYLKSTGIGDTAFFGPEAEFFVFDSLVYDHTPAGSFYRIDSKEASWNSGKEEIGGFAIRPKGGYFPVPPVDKLQDLRGEMFSNLMEVGVEVEIHHHEVASAGQCEIDMKFDSCLRMADKVQKYKYVVKSTAFQYGMVATFMPKPLFGDNGSGMHVHLSIWKNGETIMYDEAGYAGLSDQARYMIGGILKHAPSLLAFCAPTTNSYRRLVPGYEAPINLMYSQRNRSACVRIPMYSKSPKAKRIEFRAPDPTANPYLAFPAILMAALDGIQNRIEPPKPLDKDLYELPPAERKDIPQTPGSLRATLQALRDDHDYLLKGDVFTQDLIDSYIEYKLANECDAVDLRPHPYEFYLYSDI
ncbi:MAG TPA: type I glutamate--ammonia ligase [Armatimonadetes bacterium]|nr:type I glutamate--ammonia ligase [Armatimonadota bacterium]MCA1997488.1 type I glutamate--ammonia ligase [Armatimonadota bacterium]HCE00145.1 type I glutamate--ammonia ligase [Armatimonadota bacterium]